MGASNRDFLDYARIVLIWAGYFFVWTILSSLIQALTGDSTIAFAVMAGLAILLSYLAKKTVAERRRRINELRSSIEYHVTESGIIAKAGRTETKYQWNDIESCSIVDDAIIVAIRGEGSLGMRRQIFSSDEEFTATYEHILQCSRHEIVGHG